MSCFFGWDLVIMICSFPRSSVINAYCFKGRISGVCDGERLFGVLGVDVASLTEIEESNGIVTAFGGCPHMSA